MSDLLQLTVSADNSALEKALDALKDLTFREIEKEPLTLRIRMADSDESEKRDRIVLRPIVEWHSSRDHQWRVFPNELDAGLVETASETDAAGGLLNIGDAIHALQTAQAGSPALDMAVAYHVPDAPKGYRYSQNLEAALSLTSKFGLHCHISMAEDPARKFKSRVEAKFGEGFATGATEALAICAAVLIHLKVTRQ